MLSRKNRFALLLACCLVFITAPAHAAGMTFTFDNNGGNGDGDWNNAINWVEDALPDAGDDVVITESIFSNSGAPAHIRTLLFTGSGTLGISVTADDGATFSDNTSLVSSAVLTGDATFNHSSFNDGTVAGLATFNDAAINYGTINGDTVFNGANINHGRIVGHVILRDSSYNNDTATIDGDADLYDSSYNAGTITGTGTLHMFHATGDLVTISHDLGFMGTGIVQGGVYDDAGALINSWELTNTSILNGVLKGDITLYDNSQNFGVVTGDGVFYDVSDNSRGVIQGNATFHDTSFNGGIVMGNAHFYDVSENQGVANSNAYFMALTGVFGVVTISRNPAFNGTGTVGGTVFDSMNLPIISWEFRNASGLSGILKGNASFYDTSINNGAIYGNGMFYDVSTNNGIIYGNGYFVRTAINIVGTLITGTTTILDVFPPREGNGGGGGGGSSLPGGPTLPAPTPTTPAPTPSPTPVPDDDTLISNDMPICPDKWYRTCDMIVEPPLETFDPFYDNMKCEGIFTVNEGGAYQSRQEVVSIALKMRYKNQAMNFIAPTAYRNIFTDVSSSSFYLPTIETALQEGLITDEGTLFEPMRNTTRSEAYAMIMASVCLAPDAPEIGWQQGIHALAFENGLTNREWNNFLPNEAIQARELHVLTARAADWAEKTGGCNPRPVECQ